MSRIQKVFFVAFVLISSVANARKGDDIVVKGKAPLWSSKSSTEEISKACSTEKEPTQKQLACQAAVNRYSTKSDLKFLPPEAKGQAEALIQGYKADPKNEASLFALHDAHQTLGRLALREGQTAEAAKHLTESVSGPSTPALIHRGGSLQLANELLAKGEGKSVSDYLSKLSAMMSDKAMQEKIASWKAEISKGKTPLLSWE